MCPYLELCLTSVARAIEGIDAEIIVVDNASTDDSIKMLARKFPAVKVMANKINLGFAKANNLGVAMARGRYVCVLNPDTVVPEDCFEELLAFAERQKNLGAIGIKFIDGAGRYLPESKRNLPTPQVALAKMLGRSKKYYNSVVKEKGVGQTDVLVGAFMFLKKETYQAVGGFDENYFMYGEDIDLSYCLQKAGLTNFYYGALAAIHFKGESTLRDKTYANNFYGAMGIFYTKHFKKNFWETKAVNALLKTAKLVNTFRVKEKAKSAPDLQWVLFSEDPDFIKRVQSRFGLNASNIYKTENDGIRETNIIFDAGLWPYKAIINKMGILNRLKNRFFIRPPGRNFILGSESSTRRGAVFFLE